MPLQLFYGEKIAKFPFGLIHLLQIGDICIWKYTIKTYLQLKYIYLLKCRYLYLNADIK